jgi:hypothetical protein
MTHVLEAKTSAQPSDGEDNDRGGFGGCWSATRITEKFPASLILRNLAAREVPQMCVQRNNRTGLFLVRCNYQKQYLKRKRDSLRHDYCIGNFQCGQQMMLSQDLYMSRRQASLRAARGVRIPYSAVSYCTINLLLASWDHTSKHRSHRASKFVRERIH